MRRTSWRGRCSRCLQASEAEWPIASAWVSATPHPARPLGSPRRRRGRQLPHCVGKLGWVALQQLGERAFELGEALVHLDHLVRADRVVGVDIGLVLGPLRATVTAVEQVAVGVRAVYVYRRLFGAPPTGAFTLVRFQL